MDMKKAIALTVLAAAVSTSAAGAASAASAKPATKPAAVTTKAPATTVKAPVLQVKTAVFTINYLPASIRTVSSKGETLVALRDLSSALQASLTTESGVTTVELGDKSLSLKLGAKQVQAGDAVINLSQPVISVSGTLFVPVRPIVQALGGTLAATPNGLAINTIKLLVGGENARFISSTQALVSVSKDDTRTDYVIDVASGTSTEVLSSVGTSDLVVAPNGGKAAYTDADGGIYVLDLGTKRSTQITKDNNIKPELVWSADSSTIFFLQGDKGSVIAKIDPASGTISKVVDDKVDYKSALNVSADGKKFTYLVTTPPKATADATDLDKDTVAIDASAESVHLFRIDTSVEKPAAVQLTTTTDDKLFAQAIDASTVYYVSVPSSDANATVVSVDKDKKATTVFAEGDVEEAVLSGGKLYVLTSVNDTESAIYEVDPAGTSKQLLYKVPGEASNLVVNGSQVIVKLQDGLYTNVNNQWKPVSK